MHAHPSSIILPSPPPVKKEEIMEELKLSPGQITYASPPAKRPLELDAKDLENQQISFRIPSSSLYNNYPSLHPSIPSSFNHNGNGLLDYQRSRYYRNSEITSSNRLPSSSPAMPALLDKNGKAPFPMPSKSAVLYHQMDDDDEMQICVSPSAGFSISITKHLVSRNVFKDPSSKPAVSNGFQKSEAYQRNHVVIDELQDEFQMPCVKTKSSYFNGKIQHALPVQPSVTCGTVARNDSALAMLKDRARRLRRLHAQFLRRESLALSNGDCGNDDDTDNITKRRMRKLINGRDTLRRNNSVKSASSLVRFTDTSGDPRQGDPRASPRPNF
ncbi:unnamed protein product [Orchesella dallaii]|uniref:Uncharacterized protein n=1 Tax=Orchesella dallaii TaxID=48710 RepID=A0ABP1PPH3_9HEXA